MTRILLALLLACASAFAQTLEESIDVALDERTAPAQRVRALERVAKAQGGYDRLAETGLAPSLDSEVVHAVVDTLLQAPDLKPYLERICRLLLDEAHRDKVRQRIQVLGEHPERARPLLEECGRIAREGADLETKRAAILALAEIPQRRALEIILEVGRAEEKLRPTAREHLEMYLGTSTLDEAAAHLARYPRDSFWDLVRRHMVRMRVKVREHEQLARDLIATAPLDRILQRLEAPESEGGIRQAAAARLRELVSRNELKEPALVAGKVFAIFVAERDRGEAADAGTLAALCETLRALGTRPGGEKPPLWEAVEKKQVLDAVEMLARWTGRAKELQQLGTAAVRLLNAVDDEGRVLSAFAENFGSTEVRKEAIQYLGALASRVKEQRVYVGLKLAQILERGEKDAAVRTQILATLTQHDVPVDARALAAVRGYLSEREPQPPLTDAEIRDCITIVAAAAEAEAAETLLKVARDHPKLQVRRYAVEEGLLSRARREKDDAKRAQTLGQLRDLALSADQPEEARLAVIEALGRKGPRLAHATLNEILRAPDLSEALRVAAAEAKLALATRLATPNEGGTQDRGDLETAALILEEERGRDPERMEKLAEAIVRAGDAAKLPVLSARLMRARLYAKRADPDEKVLLGLYDEAAAKAKADGLASDLQRELLMVYKDLLLKGTPSNERLQRAVRCLTDLAVLTQAQKDPRGAAELYLRAADCALKLKEPALADEMLNRAMNTTGVGGDLVREEQRLRTELEKLRKSGTG